MHIHGGDIYRYENTADFSANINFRGMPAHVREAALEAIDRSVHYPEPDCRQVRHVLSGKEGVPEETMICGNGAAELMFLLAEALQPQKAVLAQPCFFEYEQALSAVGCELCHVTLSAENGFHLGECFVEQIPPDADLVVLGNPNNPTGQIIERRVLDRLIEWSSQGKRMLVLDESFFDFLTKEDRMRTAECAGIAGNPVQGRNLFVLKSFTKMYAMPGLRFGYGICGNARLLQRMRALTQPWNVSLPAQMAAQAAAQETAFARETAEQVAGNRCWMQEQMRALGYHVFDSETNYLLFTGPKDLKEKCLRNGFLIRDCSNFRGLSDESIPMDAQGRSGRYYRICIRSQKENEAILHALADAVRI